MYVLHHHYRWYFKTGKILYSIQPNICFAEPTLRPAFFISWLLLRFILLTNQFGTGNDITPIGLIPFVRTQLWFFHK